MEQEKTNKAKEAFKEATQNKVVKTFLIVGVTLGGIWLLGKAFKVCASAVDGFKELRDSIKS